MSGNAVTREEFEELKVELREEIKEEILDLRIKCNDMSEWLKVRGVDVAVQRGALHEKEVARMNDMLEDLLKTLATKDEVSRVRSDLNSFKVEVREKLSQQEQKLDLAFEKLQEHDRRFDAIDKRFDAVDKRLDGLDASLQRLESLILSRLPEK
ncbi:hypothetical protein [Endozoicomonas sp. 4G]|uniref:hypothetical protein n=1 Tax=Endozoicomonas sp. 4G TaxID=2872754 RepID=UPI00207884C1|nr:hypothetical protein [Endozoicomonas sp. 4G]